MANDVLLSSIHLTSKLLQGLEDTEYIEVTFTVLLVFSSPVIVSLEVLFALMASMFVLRANWLSLLSRTGKTSVIKLFACVAVVLLEACCIEKNVFATCTMNITMAAFMTCDKISNCLGII